MGKRKGSGTEEELLSVDSPSSSHKKHKKHKKKHKKRRDHDLDPFALGAPGGLAKPAIKLKLKIGGETLGTKNITPVDQKQKDSSEDSQDQIIDVLNDTWGSPPSAAITATITSSTVSDIPSAQPSTLASPALGEKKEDTSDEEKEWLDALEKGDLDDSGMLKKSKDPRLLTARQRALIHGNKEEALLELPSGYKQVELTEEQQLKRVQRAKKRRQQAHEKREKDKKLTLDRLLKKQDSKKKGKGFKRANIPRFRYTNNQSRITISVPVGFQLPFTAQTTRPPKAKEYCSISGCKNVKKYACSRTGVPLCSLGCYKKNSLLHNLPSVRAAS
ncbi:INO80 complex subunit B-like [Mizuhopecten yessoensis]|uniref:INO80 complex subunit B n=1 Tax=Mizuhopecten yessoensis TaxID=6573 RepID=A0A210PIU3_MIZYE|nr:INO80 complex subunit B-like [Mizuhopecten yessoensis]OWF36417.1 INO80 complex subunit B [Mizuhopecten yessoensis]